MNKYILLVDVNSMYLSVSAAKRVHDGDPLDLRTVPSVVGGSGSRRSVFSGFVLAKSIPAKEYKIKTGDSLIEARQKCPKLIIIPPDYNLYMKCSQAMYRIICQYGDPVQRYSIDECFVEVWADSREAIEKIGHEIKDRIFAELGITTNVGIALTKVAAKQASNLKKPDMVHTIWPEEVESKMWPLPINELFMCGQKTTAKLKTIGIRTIGELAKHDIKNLEYHLKPSFANMLQMYANGLDDSPVRRTNRPVIKGIGNGTTTRFIVNEKRDAHLYIMSLTESVCMRLRSAGYSSDLVAIGITYEGFLHKSRQRKLSVAMDSTTYISGIAMELFDELWDGKTQIRKLKVRCGSLTTNDYIQLSYLEEFDFERHKKIDAAMDDIRNRYGGRAVQRACFIDSGVQSNAGGVIDEEDYPMMSSIL